MRKNRYLIIGSAKTGTTVISKTIQNTLGISNYYLEPKNIAFFDNLSELSSEFVVKILFDHWIDRPRLLNAIVYNEIKTDFLNNIFVIRDPRAQFVSRLHYIAFPYFSGRQFDESEKRKWVEIFIRKERDPMKISFRDMLIYLNENFGVFSDAQIRNTTLTSKRYAHYLKNLSNERKILIRYEDYITNNMEAHPLYNIMTGSRDVGENLNRTRRSGDTDNWSIYLVDSDKQWLNEIFKDSIEILGYTDIENLSDNIIDPVHCSEYVTRLIEEARSV